MLRLKMLVSAVALFCVIAVLPMNAARRPDVNSSSNGVGPFSLCPNSNATPFFVVLDGTQSPPAGCVKTSDPNKPNPPATYPNLSVTLSGSGFTVTITPALWERGDGQAPIAQTKRTVFQVEFTANNSGMTLQSLVTGSQLNGATYVSCDSEFPEAMSFCVSSPLLNPNNATPLALEPAAIDLADSKTTRWDFSQFTSGGTLTLMATGFPKEFSTIDKYPNSNVLTAASFVASNFLAIVNDGNGNLLTAGGITLKKALPATNDLFANAITIKKAPFSSFLDTSATGPLEILSGVSAGNQSNPQGDPVPQDPASVNAGVPCRGTWSASANRVFRSVWYKFTPATGGNYEIKTAGSRYDTGVYVFTGSPTSPTTVACNDDAPVAGTTVESSLVDFAGAAGTTYYIMVSEVPPPVGVDADGNGLAIPLADDATLEFTLRTGSSIVLSPNTALNFGLVPLKTVSQTLKITATNTTASSATVSGISIIGSGARDFQQTSNCVTTLPSGGQCTINVTFTPLAKAPLVANLLLHVSAGPSPTPINLSGTGD